MMHYIFGYESPLGGMTMAGDGERLAGLWFNGQKYFAAGLTDECAESDLPVFERAREWLDIYFSGREPGFVPPLRTDGMSAFRKAVTEIMLGIPFGRVTTYGEIAKRIERDTGRKTSARAVGGAVGHNPLSLIVPCHRIVGAGGAVTGYAGGVDKKLALLRLERVDLFSPIPAGELSPRRLQ